MPVFPLTRRGALKGLTAVGALAALGGLAHGGQRPLRFTHGVASGDPLQDRVMLWTRALPEDGEAIALNWTIARDAGFRDTVVQGTAWATAATDFTVKIDAHGLAPGERYHYRFVAEGQTSPTGRTCTLPVGDVSRYRLAVMSCAHYAAGYFNVYGAVAARDDVDVVLHLGDYIYEYGMDGYAGDIGEEIGRHVAPDRATVSLADYRERYAHYRLDPDLQALHAAKPMIAVWDDHETANDAWKTGAQNHDAATEGPYRERAEAARRAYLEWLPIRENTDDPQQIYRAFDIGKLARLIMLDTRRIGRDRQLSYSRDVPNRRWPFDVSDPDHPVPMTSEKVTPGPSVKHIEVPFDTRSEPPTPITDLDYIKTLDPDALPEGLRFLPDAERFKAERLQDPDRSMLGETQEAWVAAQLEASVASDQTWQILGQQVVMGRAPAADLMNVIDWTQLPAERRAFYEDAAWRAHNGLPFGLDAWDGYPPARERLYRRIRAAKANAVVLAGDTHNAWALELHDDAGTPVGVEFACPSVSSPGIEYWVPGNPEAVAERYLAASPELIWGDTSRRGFTVVTLEPDAARSDWYFVDTVASRDFTLRRGQSLQTTPKEHHLRPAHTNG
jgi:alkaline phosphatase D